MRYRALLRLLVVALAIGVAAPTPVEARPARAAATKAAKPQATARPARGAAKTSRMKAKSASRTRKKTPARSRRRPPAAAARRAMAIPRVTIGGAPRDGRDVVGRAPAKLTRDEATATAIEAVLRDRLRSGTTGLYVVEAATGRELFAIHPDDPLNPASNVKLISTATALELLGPEFRYRTTLLGAAPDASGTVAGDVYLLGNYDPTLSRRGLDELAQQLAARGIKRVDGDVVVSTSSSRDGLWRSRIDVTVAAGKPGGKPAVITTAGYDFVEIVTTATTSKRARARGGIGLKTKLITRDDGRTRLQLTVGGTIGKGKTVTRSFATTARHFHAAHLLRVALRDAGIALGGDVHASEMPEYLADTAARGLRPVELARHESATLAAIVAEVNKRSINWLSDRVIATAAALTGGQLPSLSGGVDAMYGWLEAIGMPRTGLRIDTGSGLSYRTELSPRQIVQVVRAATGLAPRAANDPARAAATATAFRESLAVAGVDGTLRHRFEANGLRGRVLGKTGTLARAVALSGLLAGPDGRELAFALVTNGHPPRRKGEVRKAHEQIVELLDQYLREIAEDGAGAVPVAAAPTEIRVDSRPGQDEIPALGDDLGDDEVDLPPEAPADK